MAATIQIRRWTGTGSGTGTDITGQNTRANAEDSVSSTTGNPVQIPSAGTYYSYWVATRLFAVNTPANNIGNLRWYTDGTNNFGLGIGCQAQEASVYHQATGTLGQTGDPLNSTFYTSGLQGSLITDVFAGATSGVPKSLTGNCPNGTTSDFGNWLVYQITVAINALPGATGQETFFWKYDET